MQEAEFELRAIVLALSICAIFGYGLDAVAASEFRAVASESDADKEVEDRIERLAQQAYDCRSKGDLVEAEKLFRQALKLNEPYADNPFRRKCLGHSSAEFFLFGSLLSMLEYQGRWGEAEILFRTRGSKIYNGSYCDEHLASILIKEGKYKEAYDILIKFVPDLEPPVGFGCGVPYAHYEDLKGMLRLCEEKIGAK